MAICPQCNEPQDEGAQFCANDGHRLHEPKDPFVGRILASRYRLLRRLGYGATAYVYLARHVLIDRTSAIKVLRPELAGSVAQRERFLREARAVNRIHHRNIVEISDVGESDGLAWLVMEFVDGESLYARLRRGRPEIREGAAMIAQVASALGRAHELGVIHRDLKPDNVLLTRAVIGIEDLGEVGFDPFRNDGTAPEGQPDVFRLVPGSPLVKLTDFGIAKLEDLPKLTTGDQLFGTPGYIAPEILEGAPATGASDVFALGVMLYETLTGRLPWEGRGQSQLLLAPLLSEPIPLQLLAPDVPAPLARLVMQTLLRDPMVRIADAFRVQDALIEFLAASAFRPAPAKETLAPPGVLQDFPRVVPVREEAPPPTQHGRALLPMPELPPEEPPPTIVDVLDLPPVRAEFQRADFSFSKEIERLAAIVSARATADEMAPARVNECRQKLGTAQAMVPQVDRTAVRVRHTQTTVDHLETEARTFRESLGGAIDALSRDRGQLRAVRETLDAECTITRAKGGNVASIYAEEERLDAAIADLTFQIDALSRELDRKNDAIDGRLVDATGQLEGLLAALRMLTGELARLLDDVAGALEDRRVTLARL
jgi:serine/threonine-protein kinase